MLHGAGVPDDVLAFLPGVGEVVGPALVEHPLVASISFTGSKAVGLDIIERAAVVRPGQRHVKRVVAEMGGKNPIVVDTDADLDEAVPAIVHSAFSYAGQKCSAASRLVVLRPVFEELVERLAGAIELVVIGHPSDPAVKVGPLIDADALRRVERYQELAHREAEVVVAPQGRPRRRLVRRAHAVRRPARPPAGARRDLRAAAHRPAGRRPRPRRRPRQRHRLRPHGRRVLALAGHHRAARAASCGPGTST